MSYELVTIVNSTPYTVSGIVRYLSLLCRDDRYTVEPFSTWRANSRGRCLVTEVGGTVQSFHGNIVARPYTSSGAIYSHFAVIQTSPTSFEVTRRVNLLEEVALPEGYEEPTEEQN